MTSTRRIDVHAHYLAPGYRAALETAGLAMIGGIPVPSWTPELALDFMDAHGIETQILSISDPGVSFLAGERAVALAHECNDYAAEIVERHPGRFGAFAVLPLDAPEAAAAEAARALDQLHFAGVGLLSSHAGRHLGDPAFEPLLQALDRHSAWVFVHPTAVAATDKPATTIPDFIAEYPFDTTRTIISLLVANAYQRFPHIRWHFAHGGGTIPMLRARLDVAATHAPLLAPLLGLPAHAADLRPDSAQTALANCVYDTALIAERPSLEAVAAICDTDHILFGSDWPFAGLAYPPEGDPQPALSDVFDPNTRAAIDRGNALTHLRR